MSSEIYITMVCFLEDLFGMSNVLFLVNPKTGRSASMISKETYDVVMSNAETLDSAVIYERDFQYNL